MEEIKETQETPKPKFFCFYESYGAILEVLSDAQAGKLIKSMYDMFFLDQPMNTKGKAACGLVMIKYQLEADKRKYSNVCERNRRNSQSRKKQSESSGSQS